MRWKALILVVLILFIPILTNAVKIDQEVIDKTNNLEEVSVIIKLKDKPLEQRLTVSESKKSMIKNQQNKILSTALETDFKLKHKYSTINSISGKITKEGLEKLRNDPNIESIQFDRPVHIFLDHSIPQINASLVWQLRLNSTNITGLYETICIIDTGVDYNHSALGNGWGNKIIGGYDFVNNDTDPMDDHGHGTHCAGIAASENETYKGVAPDAKIIAIKVLDSSGEGSSSDVIAGIDWCVNNASKFNISIISMSLGVENYHNNSYCDSSFQSEADAINNAVANNISVIIASGNDAPYGLGISSPACIQNATPVGGVNDADSIQYQRGDILDILAPGVNIHSAQLNGNFVDDSGTSMAAPHVAGAAALIKQFIRLQNRTDITPQAIEDTLNATGKLIDDSANSGKNYSRVNVYDAIISLDSVAPLINFVNPTPENNNLTNLNWVYINITSNEILSTALLEWNGTNQTMNGSGTNFYLNKTNLSRGIYAYKVFGNDSANNFGVSEIRNLLVNQSRPNITSYYPPYINVNISEPSNQTFNITYSDPNNDTINVTWYNNNALASTLDNYTFIGNYSTAGSYNITVIISDGYLTDSWSWNLTVNNTNRAPNSMIIPNQTLNENTNKTINLSQYFSDPNEDDLNYTSTLPNNITVSINNDTGIATLTPDPNFIGTSYIIFTAYDPYGSSNSSNNITLGVNDAPNLITQIPNMTWPEDTVNNSLNLTQYFNDSDSSNFNYTASAIENITTSISNTTGIVNITPGANFTGIRYVIFTITDGIGSTSTNNITLNITPVNDGPTASIILNITWNEDNTYSFNLSDYFSDIDGDDLNYNSTNVTNINVSINNTNKTATFTPNTNWYGVRHIIFTAQDPNGLNISSNNITLTVTNIADCGDGNCETGETCSSCSADCGDCPPSSSSGRGGGGGNYTPTSTELKDIHFFSQVTPSAPINYNLDNPQIPATNINIEVKSTVDNVEITVEAHEEKPAEATELENTYKYLTITVENLNDEDISKAIIQFKVNSTWLTQNNFDENKIILNRFHNNKWNKLQTSKKGTYYVSSTPGFSVFAITAEKIVEPEEIIEKPIEENITVEEPLIEEKNITESIEKTTSGFITKETKKRNLYLITILIVLITILIILIEKTKKRKKGKRKSQLLKFISFERFHQTFP